MKTPRLIALVVVVVSTACGCCFHKDLTNSAQAQASGLIGKTFHTVEPLVLFKDKHNRTLFLATRDYPTTSRDQPIGILEAGTELRVNRLVRVTELIAILVILPEYYSWNCTLAKIEDGSFAGKEIAVEGGVLHYVKDIATISGGKFACSKTNDNLPPEPSAIAAPGSAMRSLPQVGGDPGHGR